MIFDTLKLFRDIAQTKSVSRGASLSEISQSAASQNIQELERRLGVALFDRTTRPLALTQAGKLFHDLCRDVLGLDFHGEEDPVGVALEWGVRRLGKSVTVNAEGDLPAKAVADLFPAYDDDGGLLLVLTPSR